MTEDERRQRENEDLLAWATREDVDGVFIPIEGEYYYFFTWRDYHEFRDNGRRLPND